MFGELLVQDHKQSLLNHVLPAFVIYSKTHDILYLPYMVDDIDHMYARTHCKHQLFICVMCDHRQCEVTSFSEFSCSHTNLV